jgi:hypothetical protein
MVSEFYTSCWQGSRFPCFIFSSIYLSIYISPFFILPSIGLMCHVTKYIHFCEYQSALVVVSSVWASHSHAKGGIRPKHESLVDVN